MPGHAASSTWVHSAPILPVVVRSFFCRAHVAVSNGAGNKALASPASLICKAIHLWAMQLRCAKGLLNDLPVKLGGFEHTNCEEYHSKPQFPRWSCTSQLRQAKKGISQAKSKQLKQSQCIRMALCWFREDTGQEKSIHRVTSGTQHGHQDAEHGLASWQGCFS